MTLVISLLAVFSTQILMNVLTSVARVVCFYFVVVFLINIILNNAVNPFNDSESTVCVEDLPSIPPNMNVQFLSQFPKEPNCSMNAPFSMVNYWPSNKCILDPDTGYTIYSCTQSTWLQLFFEDSLCTIPAGNGTTPIGCAYVPPLDSYYCT